MENLPGSPTPEKQTPTAYRVDRRGVWQLIHPAVAAQPAQRLVEVRSEGAGRAAPPAGPVDPYELSEAWAEPRADNRRDTLLVHRTTEVHDLTAGDNLAFQASYAAGEVVEAVATFARRVSPYNVAREPKRQRRNFSFYEEKNRQQIWFNETPGGAGSAAPASWRAEGIAPPPPAPPRKTPPKPKVIGHKKPPPAFASAVGGTSIGSPWVSDIDPDQYAGKILILIFNIF